MRHRPTTSGRLALLGACISALGLIATVSPAGAQTTQSRLDAARRQAGELKTDRERIAEGFAEADAQQHNAQYQIGETTAEMQRVRDEIGGLQELLKKRVRTAYRMRGIGFFQFLLDATSFRDFNTRLMSLQRQTLQDEDLVLQLRKKRSELDIKERELQAQKAVFEDRKESYANQGRRLAITLNQMNDLIKRLEGQLSAEQIARLFSISRSTGGRVISLGACPVGHPHAVTNSFGAPRGGGSRRHQGNDIMAPHGTSIHAVNGGRVTRTGSGGLGGLSIYLWDGSTEYYYAHLSRISVRSGQSVGSGDIIGSNGDTGNAQGGAPHLHFEIHPGGGGAIDPYPSLSAVC